MLLEECSTQYVPEDSCDFMQSKWFYTHARAIGVVKW